MKDSELRTRAKALALHIIAVCDEVDTRKGRVVLVNFEQGSKVHFTAVRDNISKEI